MTCSSCHRDLPDDARYCLSCGAAQAHPDGRPAHRLTRRPSHAWFGGVCAGLAEYLGVDVTLVRAAWVVFSVVPGFILGGFLAYLLAWLLIPEDRVSASAPARRVLTRSTSNKRVAGVCGGLGEYFGVDATPIRLLWIVLSVVPGAIVGGVIAYGLAWLLMPKAQPQLVPHVEAHTA